MGILNKYFSEIIELRLTDRELKGFRIFLLFILLISFIDIVTQTQYALGSNFTLGQLVKSVVFLLILFYNVSLIRKFPNLVFFYLFFIYLYLVEYLAYFDHHSSVFLMKGFGIAAKTLLPFFFYYFLIDMRDRGYLSLTTIKIGFFTSSFLFCMIIILPVLLGISYANYESVGYTGMYTAGNEISSYMVIIIPVILYFYYTDPKWKSFSFILAILCVISGILTGAKTPLFAIGLSFVAVPLYLSKRKKLIITAFFLIIAVVTYLVYIVIDDITSYIPAVYNRLQLTVISRDRLIDILLGVRYEYLIKYLHDFQDRSWFDFFVGQGYTYACDFTYSIYGRYKTAEMDGIDLFARYGLIGTLFTAVAIIYSLVCHLKLTNRYSMVLSFMFLTLIANSLLAGHVLGSAFSVFILGIVFSMNALMQQQQRESESQR